MATFSQNCIYINLHLSANQTTLPFCAKPKSSVSRIYDISLHYQLLFRCHFCPKLLALNLIKKRSTEVPPDAVSCARSGPAENRVLWSGGAANDAMENSRHVVTLMWLVCTLLPWHDSQRDKSAANRTLGSRHPGARKFMGRRKLMRLTGFGALGAVALLMLPAAPRAAEMRGVTSTEIKIGETMPYSGPVSRSAHSARARSAISG